jgi:uncharacterized LabA/DUF88 family protein
MTLVHAPPPRFHAMVFIDGTNFFHRLRERRWRLRAAGIYKAVHPLVSRGELLRIYLYTSPPHFERAKQEHDNDFEQHVRVVLGHAVPTGDGNFREKGVDAMLVADLVYHAATRNCDYAVLVSVDTDFAHAIARVEDFGCRTAVVGVGVEVPERLRQAADRTQVIDEAVWRQHNEVLER